MKVLTFILLLSFSAVQAQKDDQLINTEPGRGAYSERLWKIETEPAGLYLKGFILQLSRRAFHDNLFIGLYTFSINIPDRMKVNMIDHLNPDADVRIGFELALVTRYRFLKLKDNFSGPYVGFTFGWEYFDITQTNISDLRINTYVATPHLGFEYYFFKRKNLFINPSLRCVFYVGDKSTDSSRPEKLKSFYLLPAIAGGIRF